MVSISVRVTTGLEQDEPEGSGEVCNIEASTCPEDKCCTDLKCENENKANQVKAKTYSCCELKDSETREEFAKRIAQPEGAECANCPKCGTNKYFIQI